jgi:hypothetical protein
MSFKLTRVENWNGEGASLFASLSEKEAPAHTSRGFLVVCAFLEIHLAHMPLSHRNVFVSVGKVTQLVWACVVEISRNCGIGHRQNATRESESLSRLEWF